MITFAEALQKANEFLSDSEVPVTLTLLGRFSEGWYFCYQSVAYMETGDFSEQLAGNSPFLIDQDDGKLVELGTAYPIKKYLDEYKANVQERGQEQGQVHFP